MSLWSTGSHGQWGPQLQLLESRGNRFNSQILEFLSREGEKTKVSCYVEEKKDFLTRLQDQHFKGRQLGSGCQWISFSLRCAAKRAQLCWCAALPKTQALMKAENLALVVEVE